MNRVLISSWTSSLAQDVKTVVDRYFQSVGGRAYIETLNTSSLSYKSFGFYPKKDTSSIETKQLSPGKKVTRSYDSRGKLKHETIISGNSLTLFLTNPYPTKVTTEIKQPTSLEPSTEILHLYKSKDLKYSKPDTLNGIEYYVLKTNYYPDPKRPAKLFYFDKLTGLLVAQKVNDNVTFYKDYRNVQSLLYPFVHEQYLHELLLNRDIYEKVEFNVDLTTDDFKSTSEDLPPLRNPDSKYNLMEFVDPTYSNGSLTDLLAVFKGKRILIDLWATWCGPCKYEFGKYDDNLYAFLTDKRVQLLFISLDKPEEETKWKKDLQWFNLNGYHIMAGKTLHNSIKKEINEGNPLSIPRYVLINEKGEVLSNDIGKPSSSAFKNKVSKLLD